MPSERSETGGYYVFTFVCLSDCVSVRTWLQCSTHNIFKVRTSNLTSTSTGTVRTWPLKNFSKRGRGKGDVNPAAANSLGGYMHSLSAF